MLITAADPQFATKTKGEPNLPKHGARVEMHVVCMLQAW
jgi:hypothetical protein